MSHPAGFPRQARLLRRIEFDRVFKNAGRSSDAYFTILHARGDSDRARLGLAIAKKVARRAVDRNRIKRLVRESMRQQENLPLVDLVVMTRPAAVQASNTDLFQSLRQHWQHIHRKQSHHV